MHITKIEIKKMKRLGGLEKHKAKKNRRIGYHPLIPYIFIAPVFIWFMTTRMFSLCYSSFISLHRWALIRPPNFIGIRNYILVLQDSVFYTALLNTTYYVVGVVLVGVSLSLLLALILNRMTGLFITLVRTCFFIPVVTPLAVVAVIWIWMLEPQFGIINFLLSFLRISSKAWLDDKNLVMPTLIGVSIWKDVGFNMIIFLAGLQGIPQVYYEAGELDGVNRWQSFFHITLPLLRPVTLFVFIYTTIRAFKVFTHVYVMTQGGPGNSSRVLVLHIYNTAFSFLKMGKASAMAIYLLIIIFFITAIQLKYFRSGAEF
jgi:multiple sugar transport system permease protein